jgi:hypothetical protein
MYSNITFTKKTKGNFLFSIIIKSSDNYFITNNKNDKDCKLNFMIKAIN